MTKRCGFQTGYYCCPYCLKTYHSFTIEECKNKCIVTIPSSGKDVSKTCPHCDKVFHAEGVFSMSTEDYKKAEKALRKKIKCVNVKIYFGSNMKDIC
jgi:uncharacterized Zn-finger protein